MSYRVGTITLICILLAGLPASGLAIDHANLDEGRPLLVQDPYVIGHREAAVEGGVGFVSRRRASDRFLFPIQLVYGLLPNLQVEIGTTLLTNPHDGSGNGHSGDLAFSGLYNLNRETLTLPAFGIKGSITAPTGVGSSGVDFEIVGLLLKSIHRLNIYLNGGYEFKNGTGQGERSERYKLVLGAGYPVGAPYHTRTFLLGDLFLLQAERRGTSDTVGGEIGVRYQFSERLVLDAGVGTEFRGSSERSRFLAVSGFSFAF
jgi:hypothetical protein